MQSCYPNQIYGLRILHQHPWQDVFLGLWGFRGQGEFEPLCIHSTYHLKAAQREQTWLDTLRLCLLKNRLEGNIKLSRKE